MSSTSQKQSAPLLTQSELLGPVEMHYCVTILSVSVRLLSNTTSLQHVAGVRLTFLLPQEAANGECYFEKVSIQKNVFGLV